MHYIEYIINQTVQLTKWRKTM